MYSLTCLKRDIVTVSTCYHDEGIYVFLFACSGPEKAEGDLPSYPGFEKDVFGVVRDYFIGLPEPLITYELYDVIINAFGEGAHFLMLLHFLCVQGFSRPLLFTQ